MENPIFWEKMLSMSSFNLVRSKHTDWVATESRLWCFSELIKSISKDMTHLQSRILQNNFLIMFESYLIMFSLFQCLLFFLFKISTHGDQRAL